MAYARKHSDYISTRERLAVKAIHQAVWADAIIPIHKINQSILERLIFLLDCFAMTDELRQRMQEELHKLETELRTEIPQELKKAVALGDLSENAEYESARNRQDIVRARIANLRQRLADLSMIDMTRLPKDRVAYGSTVELYDMDSGDDVTYKLAMAEDADISKNKISTTSPISFLRTTPTSHSPTITRASSRCTASGISTPSSAANSRSFSTIRCLK